jgi:hypothetical protein
LASGEGDVIFSHNKKTYKMINLDNAKLIGESKWVKDSAYRVYELDGKFYSVIIISQMNMELLEDTIKEIKEEEIKNYI